MNEEIKPGYLTSAEAMGAQWDALAGTRHTQITLGLDRSYLEILEPNLLVELQKYEISSVVDIGCGVGFLSRALANQGLDVTGIDVSSESIGIANSANLSSRLEFIVADVLSWRSQGKLFDAAVANMSFSSVLDIRQLAKSISKLIRPGSPLIFTVPHPLFWPKYWHYESEPWFNYAQEIAVDAPFSIRAQSSELRATHIHRPVSAYLNTFIELGFSLRSFNEMGFPKEDPRFLLLTFEYRPASD